MSEAQPLIGYKIVDVALGGALLSHSAPKSVEYLPGKAVTPPRNCGPLCVFGRLDLADEFSRPYFRYQLWRVEYVPSAHKGIWVPGREPCPLKYLPKGTILADSVTLLERLA